ncbi:glycosyltransferase [uncultured Phascolarctobacterium sp.]|uniref:glycosyltransferase n=1 Tax=uncultured Phascolarctobacterium sp. TaxID=512296 RepID=UPI0025EF821C|nr:glycosyltransferase [uncultured Phascolarctobacterium sp.]
MVYYIGRFPPPYGGVTVKNNMLFGLIKKSIKLIAIDTNYLRLSKPLNVLRFFGITFFKNEPFVIGVSGKAQRLLSMYFYYGNRKTMRKSILVVMGGQFANIVAEDKAYQKYISCYKKIYVETNSMLENLKEVKIDNVSLFPNCRQKPDFEIKVRENTGRLQCVFFSMIYPEKGVELVLNAAKRLPLVDFSFWGDVRKDYKENFQKAINSLKNCTYYGIFKSNGNNVYELLNQYDLLLFPTFYKNEGVPGILVEAKFAALPAIVSNFAYNAELVRNDEEGVVMQENTADMLVHEILKLDNDRTRLKRYKERTLRFSEKFIIDNYIDDIERELDR